MKFLSYLFLCIMAFGCMRGHQIMTYDRFDDLPIGMHVQDLQKKAGKPYSIKNLGNNEQEFEYLERLTMGDRVVEERHYLFIIRNGKVVSKHVTSDSRPPLEGRNAYELQTSQLTP